MKKTILLILFVCLGFSGLQAQSTGDISVKQINQQLHDQVDDHEFNNDALFLSDNLLGIFTNSTFISGLQQLAADASQVASITLEGNNNTAQINQSGFNNVGLIHVTGFSNNTGLSQNGNGLLSIIGVNGNTNDLNVIQSGNDLQNLILLEGNSLDFDIFQNATGVQLSQTGSSIPLQVERTGTQNILPIIIRNN